MLTQLTAPLNTRDDTANEEVLGIEKNALFEKEREKE